MNFENVLYICDMEIVFEKEYLRELYEDGRTSNKNYRFQPDVVKRYRDAIDKLIVAQKIEDLFLYNSLNYKKLTNTSIESIRVNNQYRIEFRTSVETTEENEIIIEITICSIIELNNHYK